MRTAKTLILMFVISLSVHNIFAEEIPQLLKYHYSNADHWTYAMGDVHPNPGNELLIIWNIRGETLGCDIFSRSGEVLIRATDEHDFTALEFTPSISSVRLKVE